MTHQRIYLVRHGETDYNASGRWQGHLESMLSARGVAQAAALGEYLAATPLAAVYSSDLSRAQATARAIIGQRALPLILDARLREIHLGIFQGLTRAQIQATYPLEYNHWHLDMDYVIPQGESRRQLQQRMLAAWGDITRQAQAHTLIVTHGGAIKWLLAALFTPEATAGKGIENTSLTTLERNGDDWHLVEFAALPHLREG